MKWYRFSWSKRRSVGKYTRANDQHLQTYRPRFDALEERLPPGDTVLGGLLAWALLAREGRTSLAWGLSPWGAGEQSFGQPRRSDRVIPPSEFLSPFQGSGGHERVDSQGWRPGLPTVAPPGMANDLTGGTVSNPVPPPRGAAPCGAAVVPPFSRPADAAKGSPGRAPPQPFGVRPVFPDREGTPQQVRLGGPLLESVADTKPPPAGPASGVHALFNLDIKA